MGNLIRYLLLRLAGQYRRNITPLVKCSRAAISPLTALMLLPICGAIAYSVELGGWQYTQRSMQNAADTAALAAAINNNSSLVGTDPNSPPYYEVEAQAAAKQFGFVDGQNNTTVTAGRTTCPTGVASGVTCYAATITTKFPLLFSGVVGFSGDTTYGSGRGQSILATAIATTAGGSTGTLTTPCVWTKTSLTTKGTPKADLTGCTVLSSGGMNCNGQGIKADYAVGPTPDKDCPQNPNNALVAGGSSGATIPPDPYASKASNIPANSSSCPTSALTKGSPTSTCLYYGSGLQLTGNYTITQPNTVIVVGGSGLNLNSNTLSTSGTGSATIIFTGSSAGFTDKSNGNGIVNIQAPNSGVWSGVAVYQDPNCCTTDVSTTIAGAKNGQAWTITGLVYLPHSDVTIDGAVNHFAGAPTCMVLVVDILEVAGGGSLLQSPTGCNVAGLTVPSVQVSPSTLTRQKLVQ
jgi:Flp pilus assembly protein TadG